MSTEIKVGIGDARQAAQGFVDAWHRAERGQISGEAEERIVFEDLETLIRTLTPARWNLLRALCGGEPTSVRALSRKLGRDYKNVHSDVAVLERLGLITRDRAGEIQVLWTSIVAELRLAA